MVTPAFTSNRNSSCTLKPGYTSETPRSVPTPILGRRLRAGSRPIRRGCNTSGSVGSTHQILFFIRRRLVMRSVRLGLALLLSVGSPAVLAQQKFDRISQSIGDLIEE